MRSIMRSIKHANWSYIYTSFSERIYAASAMSMHMMVGLSLMGMLVIGFPQSHAMFPEIYENAILENWWYSEPFSGDVAVHFTIVCVYVVSPMIRQMLATFAVPGEEDKEDTAQFMSMMPLILLFLVSLSSSYNIVFIYSMAFIMFLAIFGVLGFLNDILVWRERTVCSNPS